MSALGTMNLHIYEDLEQGTPEWFALRAGIITASVVGQLVSYRQPSAGEAYCPQCGSAEGEPCIGTRSPTPLKTAHPARAAAARMQPRIIRADLDNDTARALILNLAAERITGHVEQVFPSRDMERGTLDEPYARDVYAERYAPVEEVGFMVRDFGSCTLGYSPDGIVGDKGLIEIKSRKQKIQLKAFLEDTVPAENMAQLQTGLLVSGREWCDYVSYSGGMPPYVKRVWPDPKWFDAILSAAEQVENNIAEMVSTYLARTANNPPTERIDHYADLELKL